ncbi:T9SS type A sorting domain-containing protein [candidate division KSB1 bacterium]|nr:T9SS type A sorting domain-containing protein [candidate division KSB1 bacterium]
MNRAKKCFAALLLLLWATSGDVLSQEWSTYAGQWSGSWQNQTAGTTGPFYADISGDADSDSFTVRMKTYGAFGVADTLRLETIGTLDREMGMAQLNAPAPFSGLIVLMGGLVSGQISALGTTVNLTGTYSDTLMTIQYTMSGLLNAVGVLQLKKDPPTRVLATSGSGQPLVFDLKNNYPNPFNPSTTIEFSLAVPGLTSLTIHNLLGQSVRILTAAALPAGRHAVVWDGRDDNGRLLPSGIYFYRLDHPDFSRTRRMVFSK